MGKDNLGLGGRAKSDKRPNMRMQNAAEMRKQPRLELEQAQVDPQGEFGDGTTLTKDWRKVPTVVGPVLRQKLEICWAIVLARVLQAIFNIRFIEEKVADHMEFSHDDLVVHLKLKKKEHRASLKLQNIKDAIDHIEKKGLLKIKSTKAGSQVGFHGKWNFRTEKSPNVDFIRSKVDISPVAISFEINSDFHDVLKNIYKVRDLSSEQLEEDDIEGHAVLIVGYGYTTDGRLFFLTQNSWGDHWGVKGYGRIFIDENSKTQIVYPEV